MYVCLSFFRYLVRYFCLYLCVFSLSFLPSLCRYFSLPFFLSVVCIYLVFCLFMCSFVLYVCCYFVRSFVRSSVIYVWCLYSCISVLVCLVRVCFVIYAGLSSCIYLFPTGFFIRIVRSFFLSFVSSFFMYVSLYLATSLFCYLCIYAS